MGPHRDWGGEHREAKSWGNTYFRFNIKEIIGIGAILVTVVTTILVLKNERTMALTRIDTIVKFLRERSATKDDISDVRQDVSDVKQQVDDLSTRVQNVEAKVNAAAPLTKQIAKKLNVAKPTAAPAKRRKRRVASADQEWLEYDQKNASEWLDDQAGNR